MCSIKLRLLITFSGAVWKMFCMCGGTTDNYISMERLSAARSAATVFVMRGHNAKNEIGCAEFECNEAKG